MTGEHNGAIKIAVTAPPDKGKANDALQETLAEALAVRRSDVALLSGMTSRNKEFLIRGIESAELDRRLRILLASLEP